MKGSGQGAEQRTKLAAIIIRTVEECAEERNGTAQVMGSCGKGSRMVF